MCLRDPMCLRVPMYLLVLVRGSCLRLQCHGNYLYQTHTPYNIYYDLFLLIKRPKCRVHFGDRAGYCSWMTIQSFEWPTSRCWNSWAFWNGTSRLLKTANSASAYSNNSNPPTQSISSSWTCTWVHQEGSWRGSVLFVKFDVYWPMGRSRLHSLLSLLVPLVTTCIKSSSALAQIASGGSPFPSPHNLCAKFVNSSTIMWRMWRVWRVWRVIKMIKMKMYINAMIINRIPLLIPLILLTSPRSVESGRSCLRMTRISHAWSWRRKLNKSWENTLTSPSFVTPNPSINISHWKRTLRPFQILTSLSWINILEMKPSPEPTSSEESARLAIIDP